MTRLTWRQKAHAIIYRIMMENKDATPTELRTIIRKAYPWHVRKNHPYKAWCQAINDLLGPARDPKKPIKPPADPNYTLPWE